MKSSSYSNHCRELMGGENQCEAYSEWTSELQTELSGIEKVGFGDNLLVTEV